MRREEIRPGVRIIKNGYIPLRVLKVTPKWVVTQRPLIGNRVVIEKIPMAHILSCSLYSKP